MTESQPGQNVNPLKKYYRQPKQFIKLPSGYKYYPDGAIEVSESGEVAVYPMTAKDESVMNEIFHDDYKFTMHASGNVLGKADVIKWAMSGDINKDKVRVLFENDEIGVEHSFVTFNDGNKEAVMAVYKYKDGKVVSLETGATKIPK